MTIKGLTKPQDKKLDKMIETFYYKHARGRQIMILNIPKLYAMAKHAHLAGNVPLEDAVKAAITTYCTVDEVRA